MIVILTVVAVIAGAIYFIFNGKANYWTDRGVTSVKFTNPLWKLITRDLTIIKEDVEVYKLLKGKRFAGFVELGQPTLVVTDLDLAKQILIKDFDHFVNRRSIEVEKNDPHFHFALPNQTGEKWKELRSRVSPTFTTGRIRRMFSIFDSSAKKMVKFINEEIRVNNEIEMRPVFQKLAMDVIASAAFGVETNLFEDSNSIFIKMGKYIQETFAGINLFKLLPLSLFPKLSEKLKIRMTNAEADRFLSKLVVDALNRRQTTNEKRDDFLQLMLEARQGKLKEEDESQLDEYEKDAKLKDAPKSSKIVLNDDLIISQSLVFFVAGTDTVDTLFGFAVYEIGIHPEIQEKLYQELRAAVDQNEGEFSFDIINSLEYLGMVLSETLRKYLGGRVERQCTKAYKIPGTNVMLEKDVIVFVPTYAIHHDPEYYPNPEKFDPLRFTKENVSKRHPCAYQPFGIGPRSCIGIRFALSEAKTAIAHLILNFKVGTLRKNYDTYEDGKPANAQTSR